MNILTARRLFTFVREEMMYAEFNSVALFTVLYSQFKHCAEDVSKVTAQPTILEYAIEDLSKRFIFQNIIPGSGLTV